MVSNNRLLRDKAEQGKAMYLSGAISREEARDYIEPYVEAYNALAKEKAKKYGVKARSISFVSYMR